MLIKLVKYKNRSYILQYYCTGKKKKKQELTQIWKMRKYIIISKIYIHMQT